VKLVPIPLLVSPVKLTEPNNHPNVLVKPTTWTVTKMELVVNVTINVKNVLKPTIGLTEDIVLLVPKEELTTHHNVTVHSVILKLDKFVNNVTNKDVKPVLITLTTVTLVMLTESNLHHLVHVTMVTMKISTKNVSVVTPDV